MKPGLRATIHRRTMPQNNDLQHPWLVTPKLDGRTLFYFRVTAPSHPEAMQAAQVLLRDLDRELMAEVHASRATRRTQTDPHTMEATA